MRVLTYKEDKREKLAIVIGDIVYDILSVSDSVSEFKAISKPKFFGQDINTMSMIDLINLGEKGLEILREIAAYIRWHREHGDPFLLRNAVRKKKKSLGYRQSHNLQ